jgi:hypothetical protein
MAELFAGLNRAHGVFNPKKAKLVGEKIEGGQFTEKTAPVAKHWLSHIAGRMGLGIYPLRDDGTVSWGAIDVDDYQLGQNHDAGLKALEAKIRELNLPLTLSRTKSGGAHLFVFFESPVSAAIAQQILNTWAKALGVTSRDKKTGKTHTCEIFPKQTAMAEGGLGNWLNMPYFGNGSTDRYAIHDGKKLSIDEFLVTAASKKVPPEKLAALAADRNRNGDGAADRNRADDADNADDDADRNEDKFNPADVLKNGAVKGERNDKLFKLVSSDLARGRPYEVAEARACSFGDKSTPQISHKECRAMVGRLYGRYEAGAPVTLYNLARTLRRARVPVDSIKKSVKKAAAKIDPPFTGDTDKMVERVCEKYAEPETDSPYYIEGTEFRRDVLLQGKNPVPKRISKGVIEIVADRRRDDGAEVTREYLLRGKNGKAVIEAAIPASHLNPRNLDEWLPNLFGPKYIVEVGETQHFIAAIKHGSLTPEELRILTRSGWHDDRYLNGSYPDVELPTQLKPLHIPPPMIGADRIPAIRAALNLLKLGRPEVMYPALAAPFRAVLGIVPDFAMAFVGRTGIFKSALAVLIQQFFGAGFDWEHIPGSWSSTVNQIELLGFHAKDAVFLVDEFKPSGSDRTRAQHYADLDRIVRGMANRSARGRLDAKLNIRIEKPMRCLLVITAEEGAIGESLVGRIYAIDMKSGDITSAALTTAQADAKAGKFVTALSGFIDWMTPRLATVQAKARESFERHRQEAQRLGLHARTPGIIAQLYTALALFIDDYAHKQAHALDAAEARDLLATGWQALNEAGSKTQAASLRAADPVEIYFANLRAAISSGNAYIANTLGKAPLLGADLDFRAACGWRERPVFGDWESRGDCIGWIDADKTGHVQIYLHPISSFKAAQRMAVGVEQKIPIKEHALRRHLKDSNRLVAWEDEITTKRKSICGKQDQLLWVKTEDVLGPDPEPAPDVDKLFEEACAADPADLVSN